MSACLVNAVVSLAEGPTVSGSCDVSMGNRNSTAHLIALTAAGEAPFWKPT